MNKSFVISIVYLACLPALALGDENAVCDKLFSELNDRLSTAYISLDSECYANGEASVCAPPPSPECQMQYDALAQQSTGEYDAFTKQCPNYISIAVAGEGFDVVETLTRAPSKKKMLKDIQGLKRSLRAAHKRIRSLRRNASCH